MSKQVKVFNGTTNNAAIYTVPAGRVAAVTISALNYGGSTSINITIGAVGHLVSGGAGRAPMAPITSSNVNTITPAGENSLIYGGAGGIGGCVPRVSYLNAGQSISLSSSDGSQIQYSILAVEEF